MKRALTIALASLIGAALAVPTAQASRVDPQHTRYRYFQDLSVSGQFPGRIIFGVLYEENRKGEFTPQELDSYHLQVGASCNPGGATLFGIGGNAFAKYAYFYAPLTNGGRFFHTFGSELPDTATPNPKRDLSGTVLKRLKRVGGVTRTARIDGRFNVEDWDPYGQAGVRENCTSSGSYSATPCKRRMPPGTPNFSRWKRWKVPVCYQDPW
jgi:hypothetical protein